MCNRKLDASVWSWREKSGLERDLGVNIIIHCRRRQWHPTPVLLPGKSHRQRSLVGCSPWGLEESDMTERLHFHFHFMHWRRKWQPTPVFFPGEFQGWGSLVGCHLWGCTELDTTEATQQQQQHAHCSWRDRFGSSKDHVKTEELKAARTALENTGS